MPATKQSAPAHLAPMSAGRPGHSADVDMQVLGVDIVQYRIYMLNQEWSQWFEPGVNDRRLKFPTQLAWSLFQTHPFEYMLQVACAIGSPSPEAPTRLFLADPATMKGKRVAIGPLGVGLALAGVAIVGFSLYFKHALR
eukprot:NODE_6221_length_559_cov_12.298611_g6056_i0.p1 GENE.NODE_6221_length_559_cov_12.298611_g6056_i0~~NODE_6221_length_559_cov_12.298611_g6056_i0.p1  ORF type:complete len:139 (-),score=25.01 NODE_6221_length_559_cov_12.298611_g6056_i0:59-475(-)